jgi:hypothetical protein
MIWKGCGRKLPWPNLRNYPSIHLQWLRKAMKSLSHDSQFPGRDCNPQPREFEAGVLSARPRYAVEYYYM